ncbi:TPA: hypothetical protein NJY08_004780 [Salmonella enterica subsp. enterica serovar Typhi str. AG3]|nr:hypothetical protein [Salmonella enterica subsp. enterica serovar Typhi str. AG3]
MKCIIKMFQNKNTSTVIVKNENEEHIHSDMTLDEVAETLISTTGLKSIKYERYDIQGMLLEQRNVSL